MNIKLKKFISTYGIKFVVFYLLAFFLLVTMFSKFTFQTFPGDVLIKNQSFTLYLPFTSALAVAAFFLVIIEIYKNLR